MKSIRRKILSAFSGVGLFLSACSDSTLPEYPKLGPLRVLALTANTPEVTAAGAVTLTPLISDVDGAGRTLAWTTEACMDPGVSVGATPSCESALDRVIVGGAGAGSAVVGASANAWTATLPAITVNVPVAFATAFSLLPTVNQFNGVAYIVVFRITATNGDSVTAFKRIVLTTRTAGDVNTNPTFTDILADGATLAALPTAKTSLSASFSGMQGSYPALRNDGSSTTLTEEATITWFFSDGEYERFRTTSTLTTNEWTPPTSAPAGRGVVVVGVIRDGRGGDAAIVRAL
ncbi:MAG: hypothetical protein JNL01_11770 [Bdellovibrionales bacterium]|nr:hypothetical protein [Bdellovibrionales bacterium]